MRTALLFLASLTVFAQAPRAPAKSQLPESYSGYWVPIVTEDWRFRMLTPRKGDYNSVPLNTAARKAADAWDPAKDEAAGESCKSYSAPAFWRVPGRLHITWQDDNTLKVEMDNGQQTRLFHFGDWKSRGPANLQGDTLAIMEGLGTQLPAQGGGLPPQPTNKRPHMKLVTKNLKPGYLRKNGIPFSADAVVTEFIDYIRQDEKTEWLIVTSTVEDPQFLTVPFVTSTHFRKEGDGAKWTPEPCSAR